MCFADIFLFQHSSVRLIKTSHVHWKLKAANILLTTKVQFQLFVSPFNFISRSCALVANQNGIVIKCQKVA